jgi:hypothetical protein
MLTGRNLRFGADAVSEFDPRLETPKGTPAQPPAGGKVLQITTATGRGKDTYVQPLYPSKNFSDVLLLVKNTAARNSDYYRKAYLAFDLASLGGRQVKDAQLTLTFAPTGLGFAAEVPDATFAVYGLADDALDGWSEKAVRWNDAPANRPGGAELDWAKVTLLGTFQIPQGVQSGAHGVGGKALAEFLNRDANGLATLIVVRETPGSGRHDLVHGFANKDHPQLPPPTLKLTVEP